MIDLCVMAVAPANGNCNHFVKDLVHACEAEADKDARSETSADSGIAFDRTERAGKTSSQSISPDDITGLRVTRVFSSSRNAPLRQMSEEQAAHRKVGHKHGEVSDCHGFEFKLHSSKKRRSGKGDGFSLEQAVLDEADKGELNYMVRIHDDSGDYDSGELVDVWEVFRMHMQASRDGTFDWKDEEARHEYEVSYRWCKADICTRTNVMVTTTGNARAGEVIYDWKPPKCRGYIIMIDEAAKDQEINIWNAIFAKGERVKGVLMFGDEKYVPRAFRLHLTC